jgi:hypothetical protein
LVNKEEGGNGTVKENRKGDRHEEKNQHKQ